jgi:hypothetical protein
MTLRVHIIKSIIVDFIRPKIFIVKKTIFISTRDFFSMNDVY